VSVATRGRVSAASQRTEKQPKRSLVMEDLGDETLVRISTPKRSSTDAPSCAAAKRVSAEDAEVSKRPKAQSEEAKEEDASLTEKKQIIDAIGSKDNPVENLSN